MIIELINMKLQFFEIQIINDINYNIYHVNKNINNYIFRNTIQNFIN